MTLHSFQNKKKCRALIRRYKCWKCTCAIVHLCNDGAFKYNFPVGCLFRALFNDK